MRYGIFAKKLRFTAVNENGEALFCRKEAKTGSRTTRQMTCLTAEDIEDLRRQTQRSLGNALRQVPLPQGH
jgi:hypothetical protein